MLIIGSHVSFNPKQLLSAASEAISYGANTFMFYTGAPTNTIRKDIDESYLKEALELMQEHGILINNVICHAPYIINLANKAKAEQWNFSISFLQNEIIRCSKMGIRFLVLHPGSAVGIEKEEGLNNIIEALNNINYNYNVKVLLETMAGKGSECGTSTTEIAYLLNGVNDKEHLGVCLDTCHLNDSGYDLASFSSYLEEFDKLVGISKIGCVHINDSKNVMGSHKDRHANIGFGNIPFNVLLDIIYNTYLESVPKILETPYIGDTDDSKDRLYPPYKFEIEMIKNKKFNPNILDEIRKYYN